MASPFSIVHSVCSHDCPDSCGVLVTVNEEGRAIKVQGDPAHPVTKGFLCGKVAKYLDRVYSPDRLLYPMRRRKEAAKGQRVKGREAEAFERISWDEALELAATKLQAISDQYGSESILPYSYAGTIGVLGYGSMDRRFFHRLGASRLDRTICAEAGSEGILSVYGRKLATDTEHFHHAKLIIAWGANIHGTNIHLWPQVEKARRAGARLIVIDPYRTRTASLADWHISITPGTDSALALGMMHVILRDGLEDRDYIEKHTFGFSQLREHVAQYTPEKVAAWTGLSPREIEQLAREYATTTPAAIRLNYGVQRSENGGAAVRAVAMLPCLIGAWKHLGGGLQLSTSGAFQWDRQTIERPDLMMASPLERQARIVNMSALGQALTELDSPRVHALFVYNSNPAAVAPNQNAVLRGMMRPDLFTIVHDQFFTDTTDYADLVLPATTFLEHREIQGAYGHYYVQLSQQAIEPLGEARSNVWLFGQLGQRMGFPEECFRDTPEDLIRQALRLKEDGYSSNPWMEKVSVERLEKEGHIRLAFEQESQGKPFLPFSEGGFGTPSGRAEFYSSSLESQGLDPIPTFHPANESRFSTLAESYPLEFLARKGDNYMNSTFANLDGHRHMEARTQHRLEIHPQDAQKRGIVNGDAVEVFNARGSLRLEAMLSEAIQPGVVAGKLDWNKLAPNGQKSNVNVLTSEQLTDLGRGATFYSNLVEVRKL